MPTTVILGTGIIGLSTAYYLSHHLADNHEATPGTHTGHHIHLVEPSPELFASASGKAAGFLAKDWFAPAVAPLGEFSFDLHRNLAKEHGGRDKWGWSESVSYSLDRESDVDEDDDYQTSGDDDDRQDAPPHTNGEAAGASNGHAPTKSAGGSRTKGTDLGWLMNGSSRITLLDDPLTDDASGDDKDLPRWLRVKKTALQVISDRTSTGQVDPYRLCQFLLQECLARGVTLHHPAKATKLVRADPEDPSSATSIRLQFLDESEAAAASGQVHTTPNSSSPPDDLNGRINGKRRGNGGSMARGAKNSRSLGTSSSGSSSPPPPLRSSWAAFTSPLEDSSPESLNGEDDYFNNDKAKSNGSGEGVNGSHKAGENRSGLESDANNKTGRTLDIPCDSIVITAGCWTPRVYRTLFPNAGRIPRVTALAGHSVVMKSKRWSPQAVKKLVDTVADSESINKDGIPLANGRSKGRTASSTSGTITTSEASTKTVLASHAVFTSDPAGYSPEIFSRLGGDVWLGGLNSSAIPLPSIATLATPDPEAIDILINTGKALCGDDVEIVRSGLCFRPVAPTGRPVLAKMHEADLGDGAKVPGGVYVATGHGPWGISLSLGTGWVMGEMVLGKEPSVDVKALGRWEAQAP
ncbi:hypothetical protein PHLCEN_2v4682 [Hermanssonia centrifuga]|uniref:FAD dependent oxidoreductase domain-containing protein n=1 Tax=Hermanssonia centrifuga TaxID=98765 RepID=A0A2R6PN85_9APHY|nr:hypothetical protein PHLCEN_2v4682 [Hermanssonia centrifuga]